MGKKIKVSFEFTVDLDEIREDMDFNYDDETLKKVTTEWLGDFIKKDAPSMHERMEEEFRTMMWYGIEGELSK